MVKKDKILNVLHKVNKTNIHCVISMGLKLILNSNLFINISYLSILKLISRIKWICIKIKGCEAFPTLISLRKQFVQSMLPRFWSFRSYLDREISGVMFGKLTESIVFHKDIWYFFMRCGLLVTKIMTEIWKLENVLLNALPLFKSFDHQRMRLS